VTGERHQPGGSERRRGEAYQLAERALAGGSKTFALAAHFLPRSVRHDAAVCYAFCRRADDIIDGDGAPKGGVSSLAATDDAAPDVALERLRAEVDAIYAGTPHDDPILDGFADVVWRRRIPRAYPDALLDGFAMDVQGRRYADLGELDLYCFRVAGVVGLMMCHVLGVSRPGALPHAAQLGMAMQLTNIGRDVAEDWARGRVYLPASLVDAPPLVAGPPPRALAPALARAAHAVLARAEGLYAEGRRGLEALPWRTAFAIRVAASVYAAIGRVIAARRFDVLGDRAVVPLGRKLWLVARAAAATIFEAPRRLIRLRNRSSGPTMLGPLRFPDDVPIPS
jgi:15-cis-phytoene synthase